MVLNPVGLKVWSLHQQHHWRTCEKCTFSDPPQTSWCRTSSRSGFQEVLMWKHLMLKVYINTPAPSPLSRSTLLGWVLHWLCLPFLILLPHSSNDALYLPNKLMHSNLSFRGCSGGTHTKTSTGDPHSHRACVLVETDLFFHFFLLGWVCWDFLGGRSPTGSESLPQFSPAPTVCFLLWVC